MEKIFLCSARVPKILKNSLKNIVMMKKVSSTIILISKAYANVKLSKMILVKDTKALTKFKENVSLKNNVKVQSSSCFGIWEF
jgi:hypothetical protein